ncbi:MAG: dependent oxidoreductase [Cyanobacteria bacterium RYN_339]|nr:dependent oxidoreductase [Cyanobacteria bacterium RYN_339]
MPMEVKLKTTADVIVIGAGHNGLVSALFLARQGLDVLVLEDKHIVGGAARTEKPFKKAPNLSTSTGAYLLGVMPPELINKMGIDLKLKRRDPHYFLPTTDNRYLLFGSDQAAMKQQFVQFFSDADWRANEALQKEIGQIRDDVAPSWLEDALTIEATAEKFVRPELRQIFIDLVRKPVRDYLERFGFKSDLLKAMYAVTDGFSGLNATWDTPGTGSNFLAHNMCRLPGSDGTWMIVEGGMGAITQKIAAQAIKEGATIEVNAPVERLVMQNGVAKGVVLKDGTEIKADVVVCNADPFRMRDLIGSQHLPEDYNKRLDGYKRDGTTMKINLALKGLPKFKCLPEDRGQFGPTIHLLPDEDVVIQSLLDGFKDVQEGRLPQFPTIEWYIHTTIDPTLRDADGHHNSALFVQWVPYELKGTTWEAEEERYVKHLLSICDRFAPGTSDLVVDTHPLHPQKIESYFGITRGHIHHVDNAFAFSDRLPIQTPIQGLYSASAGCHPAGSVVGAAGHNAAMKVLKDLGKLAPASV